MDKNQKDCTYKEKCTNFKCTYKHPPQRVIPICKFQPNCTKPDCPYLHSTKSNSDGEDEGVISEESKHNSDSSDSEIEVKYCTRYCDQYECKLVHPSSRTRKCNYKAACTNFDCTYLHPASRAIQCPEGENCEKFDCKSLHPAERIKACFFGSKCFKGDCNFLHPEKIIMCGSQCSNYDCKLKHPPGRSKLCEATCCNASCEYIHPKGWDPSENQIRAEKSNFSFKKLRTQSERHQYRKENKLPILNAKEEIIARLKKEKVLVVTAATGSGKTTQLPQYAAEAFDEPGLVLCTQPRVLAAISLAQRIASEFDDSSVGENVGYKVSGGKGVRGRKIMLMTDGALVQKAQKDGLLKDVRVLIIDEAHERSLNTDLVIGIAKLIREKRPDDFYVIVASATINPKPFLEFFFGKNCKQRELEVPGRVYGIKEEEKIVDLGDGYETLADTVGEILEKNPEGNCLVFLPGSNEINKAIKKFNKISRSNWVAYPLYGGLPPEEQALVMNFDDKARNARMIVFCTDVAETSLTVPNTRIVIDTGLAKEARYDPIRRITVIEEVYVSSSSAKQRRGRAGRTSEGLYVKLYPQREIKRENIEPEIMRASLDLVILQLKVLNYDPVTFPFIDKPIKENIENSLKVLVELGCLENNVIQGITERGRLFGELPFHPKMSYFVLKGLEDFGEGEKLASIAAILTAPGSLFYFGSGSQKAEIKGKVMTQASEHFSDLEFMMETFQQWHNSGKVDFDNPVCSNCKNRVPLVLLSKNKGCRSCRIKYANEQSLNNKIMENILTTKDAVLKTFKEKIPQLSLSLQKNSKNLREVIGRCLIASFHDQLGELLFQENPGVGCHLLDQDAKGMFSSTSVFAQKQQKMFTFLVTMKITKIPNGTLIIDQVHPIENEWIDKNLKDRLKKTRKEILCIANYENLNVRYSYLLIKELRAVEQSKKWAVFTMISHDNIKNTLSVFCPKSDSIEVKKFCDDLISRQKTTDINYLTDLEIGDSQVVAQFSSGMKMTNIVQSNEFQVQMLIDRNISKKKELVEELCRNYNIKPTDIRYCFIVYQKKDKGKFAEVSFYNKDVAAMVRKQANLVDGKESFSKHSPFQYFAKVTFPVFKKSEFLEQILNNLAIKATVFRVKQKDGASSTAYSIFINNLPPNFTSESQLLSSLPSMPNLAEIKLKLDKKDNPFAILTFTNDSDRNLALQYLGSSGTLCQSVMLGGKTYKPALSAKEGKLTRSEFNVLFSDSEDLSKFYSKYKNDSSFKIDQGVKIKKINIEHLSYLREKLKSLGQLNISFSVTNDTKAHFDLELRGENIDLLSNVAKQILDSLTPTFASIIGRQQHLLFSELQSTGQLQEWARKYSVKYKLEQNGKTKNFERIEVTGDKINHGYFMAEVLNYSDFFKQRYAVMPCPKYANFFFKTGRIGSNFLKELNEEFEATAQITYLNDENQVDIYLKPRLPNFQKKLEELKGKIAQFISAHFESSPERRTETEIQNLCISCSKHPGKPLYICGHKYCEDCLKMLTKESSAKGDSIICKCKTPISLKDIKTYFSNLEIIDIARKYVNYALINEPSSKYVLCPIENCKFIRLKSKGYSVCTSCKTPSCPLCLERNDNNHEGISCEKFQDKKSHQGLDFIVKKAEEFLKNNWSYTDIAPQFEFEVNPGLELGCPALQKFARAIKNLGLKSMNNGFFAWHGTGDDAGIIGICHNGFDPSKRSGQSYGPGEYFGQAATTSHSYSRQNQRLIVSYLLNVPETKQCGNYCYVVNNPLDWRSAYNLPVLVVNYGSKMKQPVKFIKEPRTIVDFGDSFQQSNKKAEPKINHNSQALGQIPSKAFRWFWMDDSGNFKAYRDEINAIIEPKYDEFFHLKSFKTSPIIRFVDDQSREYFIDFKNMIQINAKTNYQRKIKREQTDIHLKKSDWKFLEENGMWKQFESFVLNTLEQAFQGYCQGGPAIMRNFSFPGRPETYTIDFISWQQINEQTGKTRKIQRQVIL